MAKLTDKSHRDVPFELCFKYPLERGYTFTDLSKDEIKRFQLFLNKVSKMTVSQVDYAFSRSPDKNDKYRGMQVYHYAVDDGFRIHVVLEEGYYKILRLDSNHKVHK